MTADGGSVSRHEAPVDPAADRERWYDEGFYGGRNIAECLRDGAAEFADTELYFVGGPAPVRLRLDELYDRARRLAGGLASMGVEQGDVVAIWVPNWAEGAISYQAAWMIGATVVPIIHIYGPAEVGFILRQSGAKVLIVPDQWRSIDYPMHLEAIDRPDTLEHVVIIGQADRGPGDAIAWAELADHEPIEAVSDLDADQVCLLIYTSGTTADPKGVQHSANTLAAEVRSMSEALDEAGGVYLAAFPAGHIAGVLGLLRTALLGATSVVMDRWDPTHAAELVETHGVTSTSGAPFFLSSLLDAAETDGRDLSSIRNYLVGAASVPRSLVERADRAGIPVFRAYGSTEHPVISTGTPLHTLDQRAGTDGVLTPGNEIRLLDDDDREVGPGVDGEIVSRGPELFLGYTDPALNDEAFLPGGWFRTGDIGRLDADGHLTITDRKKDVIIRGGENIASKEVEDVLSTHPAVLEAAVVGLPDERYGERVAAFVILRDGSSLGLDDVRAHFERAGVARQKTPEHLVAVDSLPRNPSGKVRKVDLRTQLRSNPTAPSPS